MVGKTAPRGNVSYFHLENYSCPDGLRWSIATGPELQGKLSPTLFPLSLHGKKEGLAMNISCLPPALLDGSFVLCNHSENLDIVLSEVAFFTQKCTRKRAANSPFYICLMPCVSNSGTHAVIWRFSAKKRDGARERENERGCFKICLFFIQLFEAHKSNFPKSHPGGM